MKADEREDMIQDLVRETRSYQRNALIFPKLAWAAYLKDWGGPEEGERPSAYIIVLGDKEVSESFGCDHSIASQNILLGATHMGLGGCIVDSVDRKRLREALQIPDRYEILHVIALGKPKEQVVRWGTVGQRNRGTRGKFC